jgi:hypothetical protein
MGYLFSHNLTYSDLNIARRIIENHNIKYLTAYLVK